MKKLLTLAALLLTSSLSHASVTLGVDVGVLADKNGNAIPDGSLVLLLADTTGGGFGAATAGTFASSNDTILAAFSMNGSGAISTPGELYNTASFTYGTNNTGAAGETLAIRWFPGITYAQYLSSVTPSIGTYFGTITNSITGSPDGGLAWTAPSDGASSIAGNGINYYTTSTGPTGPGSGTHADSTGYATVQVVPEPSSFALLGLGSVFAGWIARRKKA